jgi:hypothetical protein
VTTSTTGVSDAPEPARLTPTQRLQLADERMHEVTMASLARRPSEPESTVEIGTTAKHASKDDPQPKRLHTWSITVRGVDVQECDRIARRLDDGLSALYAHELDNGDDLAAKLAASVAAQDEGGKS